MEEIYFVWRRDFMDDHMKNMYGPMPLVVAQQYKEVCSDAVILGIIKDELC